MDDLSHWLILNRAPGIGAKTLLKLLQVYGSPDQIIAAGNSSLISNGLNNETIEFLKTANHSWLESDLQWLENDTNHILTFDSENYPQLLLELPDPPPILYLCGDPSLLNLPQLAVVGSRRPTPAGKKTSQAFSRYLAEKGLIITSGLAAGIDSHSHRGALDGGGKTIAVMGTGVDRIYPAGNRNLAHEVVAGGGLLASELPLGSPPLAGNFPRRNRIISGLSLGVLVVEAALRSGSLITARLASEQGREVFAIPGSIHNSQARGCHALIRKGAKLVEMAQDIIEELAPLLGALVDEPEINTTEKEGNPPVENSEYLQLLECMGFDPISVDELVQQCGLSVSELSSMLLLLEMEGHVSSAPGGLYCRIR